METNTTGVAIVGGGLAGLALADQLEQAGVDYRVFEARGQLGGRIESATVSGASFDLGPAWFWSVQPRMVGLCRRLNVPVFEQYSRGEILLEDAERRVHRGAGYASMEGSLRIEGGAGALIRALAGELPDGRVLLGAPVSGVSADGQLVLADGSHWQAGSIVLALPPRIAAGLRFQPTLDARQVELLDGIPTWMAGHAKFVAVYEQPFWRAEGLSGDAMSRSGPLMELHDASPAGGEPGALFGFYGVPAHIRRDHENELIEASLAQLGRLFGTRATQPVRTFLRDWATTPEIASPADHQPPMHHPAYGVPEALEGLWDGRLFFAGSEMASHNGGFMEGALERADAVARKLVGNTHRAPSDAFPNEKIY